MEAGFIGLGLMGRPMAQHLAAAGHRLHLWARRPATLDPFRDGIAQLHASPREVAQAADIVFTMVADGPDVEQVLFGDGGIAAGSRPGLAVVDMSTIPPQTARRIAQRLAESGIGFLDAPVSGGEVGAINATLTIMVGGNDEVYARVLPLFRCLGRTITLVGPNGAGQVAKACNQILTGVGVLAVAEALNFASASGVDPRRVREAMLGGSAASKILENHGQRMLDRNFRPRFKAWMHRKDVDIVLAEAARLGLRLPATAAAANELHGMVDAGLGEEDSIALFKRLEQLAPDAE